MFYDSRDNKEDFSDFIITDSSVYSYNQIFVIADKLFEGYDKRSLIIIKCYRNISTIISILGALRAGLIPILIDGDSHNLLYENLIKTYNPRYTIDCKTPYLDIYITELNKDKRVEPHKDLAILIPTSGTTGDPKLVKISYTNIETVTYSINRYLKIDNDAVSMMTLPLNYIYGLSCLFSSVASRSKFVVNNYSVNSKFFWLKIAKYNVTDLAGVPFIIDFLDKYGLPDNVWSNLKRITQAGGALNKSVFKSFSKKCTDNDVDFYVMYGQTEACPRISYLPPSFLNDKVGSVGIPIDIGNVYIDETSNFEIVYEGSNVCMGYSNSYIDLIKPDTFKGILRTGDSGYIDVDGFIYITGRLKRTIKLNGISLNLDQLESSLHLNNFNCILSGSDQFLEVYYVSNTTNPIDFILEKCKIPLSHVKFIPINNIVYFASGKIDYLSTYDNKVK